MTVTPANSAQQVQPAAPLTDHIPASQFASYYLVPLCRYANAYTAAAESVGIPVCISLGVVAHNGTVLQTRQVRSRAAAVDPGSSPSPQPADPGSSPSPQPSDSGGGSSTGIIVGVVIAVVVAALGECRRPAGRLPCGSVLGWREVDLRVSLQRAACAGG